MDAQNQLRSRKRELLHGDLTEMIIGAFLQVHRELGAGFVESVYRNALTHLLTQLGLKVECEVPVDAYFRGVRVGAFRADLIVESKVVIELKACRRIEPVFEAQLINYLAATDFEVGLLLNFGIRAAFKRFIFSRDRKGLRGIKERKSIATEDAEGTEDTE